MKIELTTYHPSLFLELAAITKRSSSDLPADVLLGEPMTEPKKVHALSAPEIITFAVTVGTAVGINLFSSWLYDRIKGRVSQLRINDQIISISITEIRLVVEHIVRTSERDKQKNG